MISSVTIFRYFDSTLVSTRTKVSGLRKFVGVSEGISCFTFLCNYLTTNKDVSEKQRRTKSNVSTKIL